jgi:dihydropyrimidinase
VIDAAGKLVLPGGIDSHVHLAQPAAPASSWPTTSRAARARRRLAATPLVMPFCMQQKGQSLRQAVKDYHAKAEGRCHVDVSFHLVISDPTPHVLGQELPALVGRRLHLLQGVHDLPGPGAQRHPAAGGVLDRARDRRAGDGARRELRRHPLPDRAAGAGRQDGAKFHAPSRPIPVEREATHRASAWRARRRADHDRARARTANRWSRSAGRRAGA